MLRIGLPCLCFFLLAQVCLADNARTVLEDALKQRTAFSTYEATVTVESDGRIRGAWLVYSNGEKVKCVVQDDPEITICLDCLEENSVIRFTPSSGNVDRALAIYDPQLISTDIVWIPDPRAIGLRTMSTLIEHGTTLEEFYNEQLRSELLIADAESEVRLSRVKGPLSFDIWIDSERHTIERLRLHSELTDNTYHVSNTYQNSSGHWVIQESRFQKFHGDKIEDEQITRVFFASLGAVLPDETFSVASITGLQPGTQVDWVMPDDRPAPFTGSMEWDGLRIAPSSAAGVRQNAVDATYSRNWLFWLNALVLSLGAFWWLLRPVRNSMNA